MSETLPQTTEETPVSLFDGKLSAQHLKFALAYIGECNFNATKAAIAAGYAERNAAVMGHRVKNRPDVHARVQAHLNEYGMSAAEWNYQTTAVARRTLEECTFVDQYDREGNPVSARMDANAKMKALELIGKAHGLFTEKVQVDVKSVEIKLNGLDLDRLGIGAGDVIEADGEVE